MKKFFSNLFGSKEGNDTNTAKILSTYEGIVHWLADKAPENWNEAVVAAKVFDDSRHMKYFYFVGSENKKKLIDLSMDEETPLFNMLHELKKQSLEKNEDWIGCRLLVTNKGKYTVKYFYEDKPLKEIADAV